MGAGGSDRVADVVMVADGVLGLLAAFLAELEQPRVEELLLGIGVSIEKNSEAVPDA